MRVGERSSLVTTNQTDFYDHFHSCLRKLPCKYNCPSEFEEEWGCGRTREYARDSFDATRATAAKSFLTIVPIFMGAMLHIVESVGNDCNEVLIPLSICLIAYSSLLLIGDCFCRIKHHIPSCHKYKTYARCWYDMSAFISGLSIALNTYNLIKMYNNCANDQGPVPRKP